MGQGIELAKKIDPENVELINAIDEMKDQLILVLVERLGGEVVIPVSEIDIAPLGKILMMEFDQDKLEFTFEVKKKN